MLVRHAIVRLCLSYHPQKLKDDHAKLVAKLEQETQSARAEEMRLRRKLEKYRSHREADRVRLAAEVDTLRGEKDAQIVAFREQSDRATTEAKRLRLAVQSAEEALNAALLDKEAAESKSLRAAKRVRCVWSTAKPVLADRLLVPCSQGFNR